MFVSCASALDARLTRPSTGYVRFNSEEELYRFSQRFVQHAFVDGGDKQAAGEAGEEEERRYRPLVELALLQAMPRDPKSRRSEVEGTIGGEQEYQAFLEEYDAQLEEENRALGAGVVQRRGIAEVLASVKKAQQEKEQEKPTAAIVQHLLSRQGGVDAILYSKKERQAMRRQAKLDQRRRAKEAKKARKQQQRARKQTKQAARASRASKNKRNKGKDKKTKKKKEKKSKPAVRQAPVKLSDTTAFPALGGS